MTEEEENCAKNVFRKGKKMYTKKKKNCEKYFCETSLRKKDVVTKNGKWQKC